MSVLMVGVRPGLYQELQKYSRAAGERGDGCAPAQRRLGRSPHGKGGIMSVSLPKESIAARIRQMICWLKEIKSQ